MTWTGSSPNRTRGRKWMAIRKRILTRDPICRMCTRNRTVSMRSVSVVVDHVISLAKGGTDDDANLEGLCDPCHKAKTAAESRGGLAPRIRREIGPDGWPIEDQR